MVDSSSIKSMIVAIPQESFPGERRVAMVPQRVAALRKAGLQIHLQAGAGVAAGFPDSQYVDQGAVVVANRAALLAQADVVLQIRSPVLESDADQADIHELKRGAVLIGFAEPFTRRAAIEAVADHGLTLLAMELLPRISRAQNMDALSSMASIAGYKAVLLAADRLAKLFPMMVTAAGTITAAKVLVLGAGVAGLQAIATARRLGAIVSGYD
ncbi:MAG: NAD(P)(+) transhydrogenase (Re/Si-specific) subunit alpha, partial [Phycisphaerae bacterium]|nr:NAD(P)(+) transhydrogenase (Re/Si-specific) subunit alpha [Phycisphaerae bacterium]